MRAGFIFSHAASFAVRSIFALAIASAAFAQKPELTLRLDKEKPVLGLLRSGVILNYPKCDSARNIYFRYLTGSVVNSSLIRIAANGESSTILNFDQLTDAAKGSRIYDFAIHNKSAYLLGLNQEGKPIVLICDDHGTFKQVMTLDRDIHPNKIAVFSTGEMLVLGSRNIATTSYEYEPALDVYDIVGRFVKSVSLKPPSLDLGGEKKPEDRFKGVDLSLVESGDSGVYIVPYGTKAEAYLISPSGEVENQVPLAIPENDMKPVSLSVGPGQLLMEYAKESTGQFKYVLFDAQTGELQYTYDTGAVSGVLACYDWNGEFVFYSDYQSGKPAQPRLRYARAR